MGVTGGVTQVGEVYRRSLGNPTIANTPARMLLRKSKVFKKHKASVKAKKKRLVQERRAMQAQDTRRNAQILAEFEAALLNRTRASR